MTPVGEHDGFDGLTIEVHSRREHIPWRTTTDVRPRVGQEWGQAHVRILAPIAAHTARDLLRSKKQRLAGVRGALLDIAKALSDAFPHLWASSIPTEPRPASQRLAVLIVPVGCSSAINLG